MTSRICICAPQARRSTFLSAIALCLIGTISSGSAAEFHVAVRGKDTNPGTKSAPFRTIQHAADLAQPGDVITVHEGTYREGVTPPRGGTSDQVRIVYQAAPGAKVEIKGSEPLRNWVQVQENIWKTTVPNSFFGGFNPYKDEIRGDWFTPKGRVHHTGAIYLNGEWLIEAARLDEVLATGGERPAWLRQTDQQYLLNVAWIKPGHSGSVSTPARSFSEQEGIQTAPCSEGGECIGWIEDGDWVKYENVKFGNDEQALEVRAASATQGGRIEVRLDSPRGEMVGSVDVPNTGGWQSWSSFKTPLKSVKGTRTVCLVFRSPKAADERTDLANTGLWFATVDDTNTTIWAQFKSVDPNREQVEFNVRRTVFYPTRPGINYITVRGFVMRHAATPWAPPTAEQVGLIGTHWSKGWLIESNIVSHSICSGIALGKYGDQWDNTSADTAEGYVKTIERALANGWNKETVGHHVVRGNTISHCEQTGIVGSLGPVFCVITGNTIHDIHTRRFFTGAEMAGIKFHGAIDTVISNNHIYRTCLGLWLDWMAQGTRISANTFHDNGCDFFVEVNHGPFVVDNNLFLSEFSHLDISEGGAYMHNLFYGRINSAPEPNRETPFHPAHSTKVAGLATIKGGDCRFYNNLFVGRGTVPGAEAGAYGLSMYNDREYSLHTGGNVFYNSARPYKNETNHTETSQDPKFKLVRESGTTTLQFTGTPEIKRARTKLVTTDLLGKAKVTGLPYENADGTPLKVDKDFLGQPRNAGHPTPGPFEDLRSVKLPIRWD